MPIIFWETCLMHPDLHFVFCCLDSWKLFFYRITLWAWLTNGHLVENVRFLLIHYFISFQQHSWLSIPLIKSPTLIKCFCDKRSPSVWDLLHFNTSYIAAILLSCYSWCKSTVRVLQGNKSNVNSNVSQM